MDTPPRAELVARAAETGAEVALDYFRGELTVETKANKTDLVTEADRSVQASIIEEIEAVYPNEPIIAEEADNPKPVPESGPAWIIDPIDGTTNFVRGSRLWATSIAVVQDNEPVGAANMLPALGDSFTADSETSRLNDAQINVSTRRDPDTFLVAVLGWGERGDRTAYAQLADTVIQRFNDIRRAGCMQAALAFLANGEVDAAITTSDPSPWDSIAGVHLVNAAGGTVTDIDGNQWRPGSGNFVASNGLAHEEILTVIEESPVTIRGTG